MEFIVTFIGEILIQTVFYLLGASVRWLFFLGQKSWKEIWDSPQKFNYNAIVGFIIFLAAVVGMFFLP